MLDSILVALFVATVVVFVAGIIQHSLLLVSVGAFMSASGFLLALIGE